MADIDTKDRSSQSGGQRIPGGGFGDNRDTGKVQPRGRACARVKNDGVEVRGWNGLVVTASDGAAERTTAQSTAHGHAGGRVVGQCERHYVGRSSGQGR